MVGSLQCGNKILMRRILVTPVYPSIIIVIPFYAAYRLHTFTVGINCLLLL